MPRYFFHVTHGDRTYRDEDGVVLSDIEAAHEWAVSDARDVMCQDAADVESWSNWRIEVCDKAGEQVLALSFLETVKGTPDRDR